MCLASPRSVPPPTPVPLKCEILSRLTDTIAVPVPSETTSALSLPASEVPPIPIAVNSLTLTTGLPSRDLGQHPRARAGGGDAFDVFEFDAEVGDQFSERPGRRGDRVVCLDRYDVQAAIFEDDGVGGRTADIDANDHKWCRLLSSPS